MDPDLDGEERVRATSGTKRGRREEDGDDRDDHTEDEAQGRGSMAGGDKAEIIRRRNCENARKARARKKMEVEQLQEQAAQLKEEHEWSKEEAQAAKDLKARADGSKKETLRKFMTYRCSNEKEYQKWADIVEESFTMTLPITPYRWFSGQDVLNNSRVLRGIKHLMTDNGSLAVLIKSLGCGTLPWRQVMEKGEGHGVTLVCDIGDEDMIVAGDTLMSCFLLRTTNAVEHGAKSEWLCRGMMSAKFCPKTSKLAAAEHVFDVTSLMRKLQKTIDDEGGMPVVPNTPLGACQPSKEARVITTSTPPFTVVRCNKSWTKLCGYTPEVIQGKTLGVLQGPSTDVDKLTTLKREIQDGQAASSLIINYKQDGSSFMNYLRVYPLIGDAVGSVTHFLGVLQEQAEESGSFSNKSIADGAVVLNNGLGGGADKAERREAAVVSRGFGTGTPPATFASMCLPRPASLGLFRGRADGGSGSLGGESHVSGAGGTRGAARLNRGSSGKEQLDDARGLGGGRAWGGGRRGLR